MDIWSLRATRPNERISWLPVIVMSDRPESQTLKGTPGRESAKDHQQPANYKRMYYVSPSKTVDYSVTSSHLYICMLV